MSDIDTNVICKLIGDVNARISNIEKNMLNKIAKIDDKIHTQAKRIGKIKEDIEVIEEKIQEITEKIERY